MGDNTPIGFSLKAITTQQYSIIEESYDASIPANFTLTFNFGKEETNKLVGVFAKYVFEQNGQNFLVLEVGCHFEIASDSWPALVQDDGGILLPVDLATHLGMIAVGTTRGVLHEKLGDTTVRVLIPLINIVDVIKNPIPIA